MTGLAAHPRKNYRINAGLKLTHNTRPSRRWLVNLLLFCALASACSLWIWSRMRDTPLLPVHGIKVEGQYQHVNHQALQQIIAPLANTNFLSVDTTSLQEQLMQVPWVQQASVSRLWPDTLVVHLSEYQVAARWGEHRLLSTTGMIFKPNENDSEQELPLLNAEDGQQNLVWQGFQELSNVIAPTGLKIARLNLDTRRSWSLQLNNGVFVILGKANTLERLRRLAIAYAKVVGPRSSNVDYIDMRYSNGMAVRWKT